MDEEKVVATIDLSHGSRERHYVARQIWQKLFDLYREGGGDLGRLDNLLCDLGTLKSYCLYGRGRHSLFWEWGANGYTIISSVAPSPGCYKIEWPIGSDTITISYKLVVY